MMPLPKISIITVVRNGVTYIERAIQSALQQSYSNLEYIIIDGGSTDGTVDVIAHYSQQLAYWHSKYDGSAALAQNIGLEHATGDLVGFLFADDWYEPDTLRKVGEAYQKYERPDVITCGAKIVANNPNSNVPLEREVFCSREELDLTLENIFFGHSLIGARFFSRELINRIGNFVAFDENKIHNFTNDHEFLIRAILNGARNIVIDHVGYVYFAHKDSVTIGRYLPSATWKQYIHIIQRIRNEHLVIANQHLKSTHLTKQQRQLFGKWHRDQIVRLLICEIYTRQWKAAIQVIKQAFQQHGLKIFARLFTVPLSIITNRLKLRIHHLKLRWSSL